MKARIMAVMVAACLMMAGVAHAELKDNGNGTITDTVQGLVWPKNANCFISSQNWMDATEKANSLASGQCGLNDQSKAGQWRLPTANELVSRTQNRSGFENVMPYYYWSSTHDDNNHSSDVNYWVVFATDGFLNSYKRETKVYVWPVRSVQ